MSKILYILILLNIFILSFGENAELKNKEFMQNLYGENKEITGEYDNTLSVECNNGIFVGNKTNDVLSFKGIPYAKPPIGDLRWKDPILAEDNNKVYQAYYFGKSPIQKEYYTQLGSFYPKSEDCLYLNIWVNTKDSSTDKPVMVFIHGGNYRGGATSDPLYDGYNLIEKYSDIILITVEYRLGLLGFIDFSSVPGGEDYKTSTNLGLLDQICALKWIQKNIKKFGGDPQKITLFGNSAGGVSASLLSLIDGTEGLFKRIISQSGPMSLTFSSEESKDLTKRLLKKSGASNMKDLLSLSEEKILEIYTSLNDYSNYAPRDGIVLPTDLYDKYKSGVTKNLDMLLGSNKDEVRYWAKTRGEFIFKLILPILYENDFKKLSDEDKKNVEDFMKLQNDKKIWNIAEFYNELIFRIPIIKQAEYHSESGGNTYVYNWQYHGEDESFGAYHGIELPYIFNNYEGNSYNGKKINIDIANKVQDMWVNFARTGNPSTPDFVWEKYESDKRKTIILNEKIEIIEDYKSDQRELIEPLLKYNFNADFSRLSFNVPQVYKIVATIIFALLALFGLIYLFRK